MRLFLPAPAAAADGVALDDDDDAGAALDDDDAGVALDVVDNAGVKADAADADFPPLTGTQAAEEAPALLGVDFDGAANDGKSSVARL